MAKDKRVPKQLWGGGIRAIGHHKPLQATPWDRCSNSIVSIPVDEEGRRTRQQRPTAVGGCHFPPREGERNSAFSPPPLPHLWKEGGGICQPRLAHKHPRPGGSPSATPGSITQVSQASPQGPAGDIGVPHGAILGLGQLGFL